MKTFLLGTVCGLGLAAGPALAADMSYPVKAPPVAVVPVFSWTGFYVGANVGFGGDKFDYPFDAFQRQLQAEAPALESSIAGNLSLTSSGFFGGGQIGYNHQFENNVVAGIEADFEASDIKGKFAGNALFTAPGLIGNASFDIGSKIEWFGTIRGRLGYSWDRVFLYATGGAAYGKVKSHASFNANGLVGPLPGVISASDTQWGWTAGAGLEYALTRNWSFKTEYLYLDLGSHTLFNNTVDDVANGFFSSASMDVSTKLHTVKAGVNYRF
ncbi:outer membrane protein [Bradyrhizobium cenepequi]|jgi:outer membrane immunogenic protein